MINIKKSQNADSRTATKKVTKESLLADSKQHIDDVQKAMQWMAYNIIYSALNHDHTKLENINEFYKDFSTTQENKDLTDSFKKMHWFKDIHLSERHHLTDRVPDDVNLFDVLERVADIVMAGMARSGKIYDEVLDTKILEKAYKNTIELLKKNVKVIEEKE
jgi:hypothetical protein